MRPLPQAKHWGIYDMKLFSAILAGLYQLLRCLFMPGKLPASCRESLGDHPDIESALRTGYPENFFETWDALCPGCLERFSNGELVKTDCGLSVCRDCIELCDGCEANVGCCVCDG